MKLQNIILEYEDGSSRSFNLSGLGSEVQAMVEAGISDFLPGSAAAKQYLIMQWQDGWKEVLAVNSTVADLIRYYVIRRIDDRGRIALDLGEGYPTLIIIERQPKEMCRLMIAGEQGVKSYGLESEIESYEGIFDAGGKKEYKKYDKANPFFNEQFSDTFDGLEDIRKCVTETLQKKGIGVAELLISSPEKKLEIYQNIARAANLYGFKNQADVYGLLEMMVRGLT